MLFRGAFDVRHVAPVAHRITSRIFISQPVLGPATSAHSGRRTFASMLLAQGHSVEAGQFLLGHVELDHVAAYLEVTKQELRDAMADLGNGWA